MGPSATPKVRGIILAGVHAWGESVLERICPRPLLPIAGRPLVWYGLEWLRRGGIHNVTICANSDTHALRSCLGDGSGLGLSLDYYEDVMPRGPAGCTRDAGLQSGDDVFVVIEGTLLPDVNLNRLLGMHAESGRALTIVAVEEKPGSGGPRTLEPAGIYVLSRAALDLVPEKGYQDIKEMWIPRLYQQGYRAVPHVVDAEAVLRVMGAGGYLRAMGRVLESMTAREAWGDDYRRFGSAWVHTSARISPSARLSGLSLIGPGVSIDRSAVIVGPTIVGPDSRIGAAAILNNVAGWSGCEVGHGAILNRCILLTGSSVEPELVVRNTVYCREPTGPAPVSFEVAIDNWALQPPAQPGASLDPTAPTVEPSLSSAGCEPGIASTPSPVCGQCERVARS